MLYEVITLGPPSIGVGTSSYYGPLVSGGVSAYFGDMLGDHFLGTAIQANGTLNVITSYSIHYTKLYDIFPHLDLRLFIVGR